MFEEEVKANRSLIPEEGLNFYFVRRLPYSEIKSKLKSINKECEELKCKIEEAKKRQDSLNSEADSKMETRDFVLRCIHWRTYMLEFLELARDKLKKSAGELVERNLDEVEKRLHDFNFRDFKKQIDLGRFLFKHSRYKEDAFLMLENLRKSEEEYENIKQIEERNRKEKAHVDLINAMPSAAAKLPQELGKLPWDIGKMLRKNRADLKAHKKTSNKLSKLLSVFEESYMEARAILEAENKTLQHVQTFTNEIVKLLVFEESMSEEGKRETLDLQAIQQHLVELSELCLETKESYTKEKADVEAKGETSDNQCIKHQLLPVNAMASASKLVWDLRKTLGKKRAQMNVTKKTFDELSKVLETKESYMKEMAHVEEKVETSNQSVLTEASLSWSSRNVDFKKTEEKDEDIKRIEEINMKENVEVETKGETLDLRHIEDQINLVNSMPSTTELQEEVGKLVWEIHEGEIEYNYRNFLIGRFSKELEDRIKTKTELEFLVDATLEQEAEAKEILSTINNAKELAEKKDVAALKELSCKQVDKLVDRLKNEAAFKSKYTYSLPEVHESKKLRRDGYLESVKAEHQDFSTLQLDPASEGDSEPITDAEDMEEDD